MSRAARGYVTEEQAKKELVRPKVTDILDNKNNPIDEQIAAKVIIIIPNPKPVLANAEGRANIPDPRIVLHKLKQEDKKVPLYFNPLDSVTESKGSLSLNDSSSDI
jgi:hypothetical protein